MLPLFMFMGLTVLSLAMSEDPSVGRGPIQKFVLFSMGPLAATFIDREARVRRTLKVMVLVASVASLAALVEFGLQYAEFQASGDIVDDPMVLARITGFMGHWMTFSGQQMLVWCAALPLLIAMNFGRFRMAAAIIGAGLILSFTRSVWVGTSVGAAVSGLYLPVRQLGRFLVPVAIMVVLASGLIAHRLSASFLEGGFVPDRGRLEMLQVGIGMIRDHPLFGVGPERVVAEFERYYRGEDMANLYTGHLHNNFLQIAAERGLLCLAALLWLLVRIGLDMVRYASSGDPWRKWSAVSGLAVLFAFVSAGLFEYNFGDSEVLMLFMFLVSIPYGTLAPETRS
jgi:O-antigen ligase